VETLENRIQERNKEIGQILLEARTERDISVTTCAKLIGTSRRRYNAMEQGEAMIGVAELEILMTFLEVPASKIWSTVDSLASSRKISLQAIPGETVHIVVGVRKVE